MDFDKGIVKTITKKKGSVIASDKVLRFMEDRIRSRVRGGQGVVRPFFSFSCRKLGAK